MYLPPMKIPEPNSVSSNGGLNYDSNTFVEEGRDSLAFFQTRGYWHIANVGKVRESDTSTRAVLRNIDVYGSLNFLLSYDERLLGDLHRAIGLPCE